jgi:hypothetical protein
MPYAHESLALNNMPSSILSIVWDSNGCRVSVRALPERVSPGSLEQSG